MGSNIKKELSQILVKDLVLDKKNPRFGGMTLKGIKITEEVMENVIKKEEATKTLYKSIRTHGVRDPIWVQKRDDGKYVVMEGNRRTVVLRMLNEDGIESEDHNDFKTVLAFKIDENVQEMDLTIQKAVLQHGKKAWGKYQEAALIRELSETYMMLAEDIAVSVNKSEKEVKKILDDMEDFIKYTEDTGDTDPKKFSFFQESPPKVRKWYGEEKNRKNYHKMITPKNGNQKIRSATMKGSLRDFNKYVLDDKDALDHLIKDKEATIETAVEMAKETDIFKELNWIGQINKLASKIRALDEDQSKKLRSDPSAMKNIISLERAINRFVKDK